MDRDKILVLIVFFLTVAALFYKVWYERHLRDIQEKQFKDSLVRLEGVVEKYSPHHGQESFYVEGKEFSIIFSRKNCYREKRSLKNGLKVVVEYAPIAGMFNNNSYPCIKSISIEE